MCNVCFGVGELKFFFLQVHVLENPPYRVLLGQPFDTLSKSVIQNNEDGSAELVLTDPNMKRIAVVSPMKRVNHQKNYKRPNIRILE